MIPLVYILIVSVDAWTDRRRVVNHKRGFVLYSLACIIAAAVIYILSGEGLLPSAIFSLITRLALFDPLRNLFAGKHWLYEGLNKRKEDQSWFDGFESWTGIPIIVLRVFYLCVYMVITFYYLILWN